MTSKLISRLTTLIAGLGLLTLACGPDDITSVGGTRRSTVQIDVRALQRPSLSERQETGISIADSLTLVVGPSTGIRQEFGASLQGSDSVITFQVTVPVGFTNFSAEVLSNNGTTIYAGSVRTEVVEDGFDVPLELSPVDAVLMLFPADAVLGSNPQDTFLIVNRGSRDLSWLIESITPELDSCNAAIGPCLTVEPGAGNTAPGETDTVVVERVASPIREYMIRFGSQVGYVDAGVQVTVAPPAPTVDLKVNGSDAPVMVESGGMAELSWATTGGPSSCNAEGDWSGSKDCAGGSESVGPLSGPATFTYVLTVANEFGSSSDMATVSVVVADNQPPTATIVLPVDNSVFALGEPITLQGFGFDPEEGVLSGDALVWTSSIDGEIGTGTSFERADLSPGTHTVTLTVTDSQGASASASVTLTVNQPPAATIEAPADGSIVTEGDAITFEGSGTDPEDGALSGDALVWSSDIDGEIGTGVSFERADLSPGTHTVTLTVTDSHGSSGAASMSLTVNQPPAATIDSPADGTVVGEGDAVSFEGSGTDPEEGALSGDALVWTSSIDGEIGTGTSFERADLSAGTHTVTLTSTDSQGAAGTASVTLTVNRPPEATIDSPPDGLIVTEGDAVIFEGSGTDPDEGALTGDALVWTSSLDGEIGTGTSFERSDLSPGQHTITLTATDSHGASGEASVTLIVNQPPEATIDSPTDGTVVAEGDGVTFEGSGADPEDGALTGDALVWTSDLDGEIGTGTSFERSDLSAGTHTITLTATDSQGAGGETSVTLIVNSPNSPPDATITLPVAVSFVLEGQTIIFEGSATDPDEGELSGGALIWTSSIDGEIGTGTTFQRADLSPGTHIITLLAIDSQGAIGAAAVLITIIALVPGPGI